MAPIPREAFRALVGEMESDAFGAFVADLWRARGAEIERDGGSIRVREGDRERVLAAVAAGERAPTDGVDVIVTAEAAPDAGAAAADAPRLVDADELRQLALYAVDRERRRALFEEHLDRPPTVEGSGPPERPAEAPTDRDWSANVPPDRERQAEPSADRERPAEAPPARKRPAEAPPARADPAEELAGRAGEPTRRGDGNGSTPDRQLRVGALVALLLVAALGVALFAGTGGFRAADQPKGSVATPGAGETERRPVAGTANPTRVPGLGGDGITDAGAVASTHARAVTDRSYTLVVTYREFRDGRATGYRREVIRVESPVVYRSSVRTAGVLVDDPGYVADVEAYANGTVRYVRTDTDEYGSQPTVIGAEIGRYAARAQSLLDRLLSARRSTVMDARTLDGVTYYFLRLEGLSIGATDGHPDVENATGSAVVDSRGVVHAVRWEYELPGREARAVVTVEYLAIGETTVDRPPWYDEARAATDGNGTRTPTDKNETQTATDGSERRTPTDGNATADGAVPRGCGGPPGGPSASVNCP